MNLLRFAARTMLASYFVVNGAKAFLKPDEHVATVEPVVATLGPTLQRALPDAAAVYLPTTTRGWVQCIGATQAVAGAMLATGIGRRIGAGLLAATMIPAVLETSPLHKQNRASGATAEFLTNVALMGGVGLAAQDTQGRPTLAWRARTRAEILSKQAANTRLQIEKDASKLAKRAGDVVSDAQRSIGSALS